jgi:hypothetical protein
MSSHARPEPRCWRQYNDGKYALKAAGGDGAVTDSDVKLVPTVGVLEGGSVQQLYRHREEITINGPDAVGDVSVSFAQTYQNVPMIVLKGGQYVSFSNTLGTGAKQRVRLQVLDATASGFKSRTQITNPGATTPQSDDFVGGNLTGTDGSPGVGNTREADLNPGGANNDTYTAHFTVFVEAHSALGAHFATLVLAIDTNDGVGGWVERATRSYNVGNTSPGTHNQTWTGEAVPVTVSGLGLNDDVRIRIKSFSVSGVSPDGNYTVTPLSPGVTYNTAADTVESAIPSAGDSVTWVAQEVT